ncbi:MAG: COR domain-containing protein, partial [Candidatus Poribacteria bacterium]
MLERKKTPEEVALERINSALKGKATKLDLSGLLLTSLPESIGKLTQLQSLDVDSNRLTSLPESIGQLTQLQILSAKNNQLTSLPESIGQLAQLKLLDASNNRLTNLPESIENLTSLEILRLSGNDALNLPKEVIDSGKAQEIIEYYFRIIAGKRPLNEAKLILVGYGDVGKTSLVKRLVYNSFDSKEKKTEGINITPWQIKLNESEDVRLHIWDFGGQEIMHSTHQFFLTQRSLYLLVLNGRKGHEDEDAEYWLSLIKSFGEDSPIIVVLNKIKEFPFDVNRRNLEDKFPKIQKFIETDCEDETGIDELRKIIEKETDRLEHLRDAFPSSWFAIKDNLAGMKENYLTFEQYRDICSKNNEDDRQGQDSLAFHLHNLGIALNYRDDPRLRDVHVLNPHWVTN